jgi:hypothetical protein
MEVKSKCVLKEFKNQQDSEKIRAFADELEEMYNEKVKMGCSRHEITMVHMKETIDMVRKLEKMIKC